MASNCRNCPTVFQALLLFWVISAFIYIQIDRASISNESNNEEKGLGKRDRERIKELYLAAETLTEEYPEMAKAFSHLNILSTREFADEPRPLTCDGCNKFEFQTIINPKDVCQGTKPLDILIQTTTVPQSERERDVIRRTWASWTWKNTNNVRHMFLFGSGWGSEDQRIIEKESEVYGDILQQGYKDSYYNLSYKVGMGYKWALEHCQRAKYVLRTAEDNFINIPRLVHYLRTNSQSLQRTQIGNMRSTMSVIRSMKSKFYVPHYEYPYEMYPPYAIGSAFLYSMAAVKEIMEAAPNVPFFALEDVWFGLVMQQINMNITSDPGFDVILMEHILQEAMTSRLCPGHGAFYSIHLMGVTPMILSILENASIQIIEGLWVACGNPSMSLHTTFRPQS